MFAKPKTKIVPVEVPERYGKRPALSELKRLFEDPHSAPAISGFVHLLMLRRTAAAMSARGAARVEKSSAFDLGGVDYLDEVFSDLNNLATSKDSGVLLKDWFAEEE